MTTDEIISRSNKLIDEQLLGGSKTFDGNSKFAEDLGADSLDMVELIMAFEEEFNIEITDDEGMEVKTVQQAYDLILAKKS